MKPLSIKQALETYRHLHNKKPDFGMDVLLPDFKTQRIVILQYEGSKSNGIPVKFDFYTLILCLDGGSIRNVNQYKYIVNKKSLQLLPPGTIHHFEDSNKYQKYYIILFEKDFSEELDILNYHNYHFENIELNFVLFENIKDTYEKIALELNAKKENYLEYTKSLLNQILIELKRLKVKNKVDVNRSRTDLICSDFLSLIESNFLSIKSVYIYAELIGISSKHLSQTVKKKLGESALHFIHKRIIKEAKYLLIYSGKTIYSIALYLNFNDASEFTRFFKKNIEISPYQYRLNNK